MSNLLKTPEILNLTLPSSFTQYLNENSSIAEIRQIELGLTHLALGIHWTIKFDWDNKYKIPANRKITAATKAYGEYLHQTFLLCSAVHARQNVLPNCKFFMDASVWFMNICQDKAFETIYSVINPPQVDDTVVHNGEAKRKLLRSLLDNPKDVEKGINPIASNPHLTNLSALIDAAIALSKQSPVFKQQYLKPFLQSWQLALKSMDSPEWQRVFIEKGKEEKGKPKKKDQLKRQLSGSKGTTRIN